MNYGQAYINHTCNKNCRLLLIIQVDSVCFTSRLGVRVFVIE